MTDDVTPSQCSVQRQVSLVVSSDSDKTSGKLFLINWRRNYVLSFNGFYYFLSNVHIVKLNIRQLSFLFCIDVIFVFVLLYNLLYVSISRIYKTLLFIILTKHLCKLWSMVNYDCIYFLCRRLKHVKQTSNSNLKLIFRKQGSDWLLLKQSACAHFAHFS